MVTNLPAVVPEAGGQDTTLFVAGGTLDGSTRADWRVSQ
jgi:hypothetical protein